MKSAYLKFLALVNDLEKRHEFQALDATEQYLLDHIAICDHKRDSTTLSKLMKIEKLGAPSTIHKKVLSLIDLGLVAQEFRLDNKKTKYLVLTEIANDHYEQLNDAMMLLLAEEEHF